MWQSTITSRGSQKRMYKLSLPLSFVFLWDYTCTHACPFLGHPQLRMLMQGDYWRQSRAGGGGGTCTCVFSDVKSCTWKWTKRAERHAAHTHTYTHSLHGSLYVYSASSSSCLPAAAAAAAAPPQRRNWTTQRRSRFPPKQHAGRKDPHPAAARSPSSSSSLARRKKVVARHRHHSFR